ncbi:MAG: class I SAM-dependent methyltransferase [bacterium]
MKSNKTIVELSKKYDTDKKMNDGNKCRNGVLGHDYAKQYDDILNDLEVKTILEIGVSWGASIKMWDEYFNDSVNIIGVDINEKRFKKKQIENKRLKIFIGNQGNEKFLNTFKNYSFDLIIDDGSHRMRDQQISFKTLFKFLRKGGVYVIEDLHTSNIVSFFDSNPETTTLELLEYMQRNETYESNYISNEEYCRILSEIKEIKIFKNKILNTEKTYIIAFIKKR